MGSEFIFHGRSGPDLSGSKMAGPARQVQLHFASRRNSFSCFSIKTATRQGNLPIFRPETGQSQNRQSATKMLPPLFIEQMQNRLGPADFEAFERSLGEVPPVSIRLNPFKCRMQNAECGILKDSEFENSALRIPYSEFGRFLPSRPVFTLDPSFHAGAYYVQEASSMFLETALRQAVDFSKPLKIIDLCAAPGGKTTLIASLLNVESLLVANEVIRPRVSVLMENLERWGCPNVAVTNADPEDFSPLAAWFDVVVVDAPCSGEGLFRKDENARKEWSPEAVQMCSARQKRILAAAEKLVAPGGLLVFSTCTYNHFENAGNAEWLTQSFDFQSVELKIDPTWGISKEEFSSGSGWQFYPHRVRGEGFFLAIFRKKEWTEKAGRTHSPTIPAAFQKLKPLARDLKNEVARWLKNGEQFSFFTTPNGEVLALPVEHEAHFLTLDKALKIKWFGIPMGEFKGRDLIPRHGLALSTACSPDLSFVDLSRREALLFLKKENLILPNAVPGWTLARFDGLGIGWMKILPNRINNYLPPNRRIRMNLSD